MITDLWQFLNGYKRIIVLALYMIAALIHALGHGDYSGHLGFVLQLLDWNAGFDVPVSVLAGTAAGIVAIGHAIKKALDESRSRQDTVSTKALKG